MYICTVQWSSTLLLQATSDIMTLSNRTINGLFYERATLRAPLVTGRLFSARSEGRVSTKNEHL